MGKSKNPWVNQMIRVEAKYDLERDHVGIVRAEEKGRVKCPDGHKAWFKPTVGTYVCSCGYLRRVGDWVKTRGTI